METTSILPPSASTTGFVTSHGHGYVQPYNDNNLAELILQNNIHANGVAIHEAASDVKDAVERAGYAGIEASNRNGMSNQSATDRNGNVLLGSVERNSGESRQLTQKVGGDVIASVERNSAETRFYVQDTKSQLLVGQKDLTREIVETKAQIQLEMCKNTGEIQLEAQKNKFELAQAAAECCCELKALILEKSCETNALLRQIESDRVRDDLAQARAELLAAKYSATSIVR